MNLCINTYGGGVGLGGGCNWESDFDQRTSLFFAVQLGNVVVLCVF